MKRTLASVFCTTLLLVAPAFADLALPGESNPILSENSMSFDSSQFNIVKRIDNNTVTIKVFSRDGKEIWASAPLGEQEKLFIVDDAATALAVKDITGDGKPELITAAMTGPESSALYVFQFDAASAKFNPMNFKYEKENLTRDFVVSDMYQKDGQDFVVAADNQIRVLGRIYSEEAAPVAGFYTFQLAGSDFVCSNVTPVPVEPPTEEKSE
jgi:hypothetical protein